MNSLHYTQHKDNIAFVRCSPYWLLLLC